MFGLALMAWILAVLLFPAAGAAGVFFLLARSGASPLWRIVGFCVAALGCEALTLPQGLWHPLADPHVLLLQTATWVPALVICEILWRRRQHKPQSSG